MGRHQVRYGEPNMHLVVAGTNEKYGEFIRKLRLHPQLKTSWVKQVKITKAQQKEYMKIHGENYYVFLDKSNKPLGFVGVVDNDLRLAVLPEYQHTGIGKFMLDFIRIKHPDMIVKVRKTNKAGQSFFTTNEIPFTLVS